MPCLKLPELPHIDLSLLLPTLDLDVTIPSVGISLCCKIETPPIPIGFISIGATGIPNLGTLMKPALILINGFIDQLNDLLDQVQFDCPLED